MCSLCNDALPEEQKNWILQLQAATTWLISNSHTNTNHLLNIKKKKKQNVINQTFNMETITTHSPSLKSHGGILNDITFDNYNIF